MFEVSSQVSFSAAHHLREYCGSCENVHGHNWLVQAAIRTEQLNSIGLAIDFKILKKHIKSVIDKLDHSDLNTVFTQEYANPSSENIAKHIYYELAKSLKQEYPYVCVYRIDVWETPGNCASYFE